MVKRLFAVLAALLLASPAAAKLVTFMPPQPAVMCGDWGCMDSSGHRMQQVSLVTYGFPAVSGALILASSYNSNFTTIYNAFNGQIDSQNISLARGIGANFINGSGAVGATYTFGGTSAYIFPNGLTANAPTGSVLLTVGASAGQTADIADVTLNAVKVFFIGSTGSSFFNAPVNFTANGSCAAANVCATNDGGATNGLLFNVPTGSTNGYQFEVAGSPIDQFTRLGYLVLPAVSNVGLSGLVGLGNDNAATPGMFFNVPTASTNGYAFDVNGTPRAELSNNTLGTGTVAPCPTINSTTTCAPAAPAYNHSGTALGGTYHVVSDVQAMSIAVGNCANLTICTVSNSGVTLSGSAAFASLSSAICTGGSYDLTALFQVFLSSGTALGITVFNDSGGSIPNATNFHVVYSCWGT